MPAELLDPARLPAPFHPAPGFGGQQGLQVFAAITSPDQTAGPIAHLPGPAPGQSSQRLAHGGTALPQRPVHPVGQGRQPLQQRQPALPEGLIQRAWRFMESSADDQLGWTAARRRKRR